LSTLGGTEGKETTSPGAKHDYIPLYQLEPGLAGRGGTIVSFGTAG